MSGAVEPVRAGPADIPAWVALVESAYRGESSRAGWTTEADLLAGQRLDAQLAAQTLEADGTVVFVVPAEQIAAVSTPPQATGDTAGGIAGVSAALAACVQLVRVDSDTAYLGMFAVAPQAQGSGLGSALMRWAEAWVQRTWGVARMRMSVIRQRTELIAYYQRRGYMPTGEFEPFPYGDERFGIPQVDDLEFAVLEKQLTGRP